MDKIRCTKCEKIFDFKMKRVKTKYIDGDIQETYLQCPNNKCGAKYPISYSNSVTRELKEAWDREGGVHGTAIHQRLVKELRKLNDYMKFITK